MRRLRRQISNFARDHRSRVFKSLAIARVGSDVAIPAGAPLHDKQDKYRVLWHSAAHLLGAALEHRYGDACFLTNGPATADGFHYDALLLRDSAQWISHRRAEISRLTKSDLLDTQNIARAISDLLQGRYGDPKFVNQDELASIQKHMYRQASSAIPFEFAHVSREQAAVMFAYSPFKLQLVNRIPQNSLITVFKCGNFVDLCRGPHIDNASRIKAIKLLQANSTIWNGDGPQVLSRIHGIAFESDIAQKDHTLQMQEAARRNHRDVGKRQALFAFDVSSPGSPFFLPHGTRIINKLLKFIRQLYMQYDYDEVITPQLFSKSLWVQSGHWQNYKENMLLLKDGSLGDDSVGTGLKAMNCPGHCILFSMAARSYRDLPMRLAEFSPLHRNEASGALTGLTRVRKFHQDDGHIFCEPRQIQHEIQETLKMVQQVYSALGFSSYKLVLSTRPERDYIGTVEQWDSAEKALSNALDSFGQPWEHNIGDGAFYGPKIDIRVSDALGRMHQTATIQLDFQLPKRFNLQYQSKSGELERPVIIHRAVLGSIERMFAILIEHYAGKWPIWLSPRQVMIIPVADACFAYGEKVLSDIKRQAEGRFHVDIDTSSNTFNKKIRDAQAQQYNFIVVVGDMEEAARTISVRSRAGAQLEPMNSQLFVDKLKKLITDQALDD